MNFSPYVRRYDVPEQPGDAAHRTALDAPELRPVMSPAPWVRRTVPLIVAGLAQLVGGIAVLLIARGFPWNAPVEQFIAILTGVGLLMSAVACGVLVLVFVLRARARRRELAGFRAFVAAHPDVEQVERPVPERPWVLALVGLCLAGGSLVLTLLVVGIPMGVSLAGGERLRYMNLAGPVWLLSGSWLTGLVLALAGERTDGGARTKLFARLGLVLGLLYLVPAIGFDIVYALGLSD